MVSYLCWIDDALFNHIYIFVVHCIVTDFWGCLFDFGNNGGTVNAGIVGNGPGWHTESTFHNANTDVLLRKDEKNVQLVEVL